MDSEKGIAWKSVGGLQGIRLHREVWKVSRGQTGWQQGLTTQRSDRDHSQLWV